MTSLAGGESSGTVVKFAYTLRKSMPVSSKVSGFDWFPTDPEKRAPSGMRSRTKHVEEEIGRSLSVRMPYSKSLFQRPRSFPVFMFTKKNAELAAAWLPVLVPEMMSSVEPGFLGRHSALFLSLQSSKRTGGASHETVAKAQWEPPEPG